MWISVLDRTSGTIVCSDETREYLLHVPNSYDPSEPTPLVISLHAGATWPAHQMSLDHWNRLADENGFIVVYPSGTPVLFDVIRIWRTTPEDVMEDVQFISALIDTLEAAYNIDPATLLGGGHSWPGGKPPPEWRVGATNTSIDATSGMWAFFLEHPLQD